MILKQLNAIHTKGEASVKTQFNKNIIFTLKYVN